MPAFPATIEHALWQPYSRGLRNAHHIKEYSEKGGRSKEISK